MICWGDLLEGRERTGQLGPVRGWLVPPEINVLQQTGEQAPTKPEVSQAEASFVLFVLWKIKRDEEMGLMILDIQKEITSLFTE